MMSCIDRGALRAYLDGETAAAARAEVARHLDACPTCRQRLAELERAAAWAGNRLPSMAPIPTAVVQERLAQFMRQAQGSPLSRKEQRMNQRANRVWRPIAAGVMIVALLVAMFSFEPSRALADKFLSIFRVRKFAVIQVSPDEAQVEALAESLQDKLFIGEPEMIADPPVVEAATIEEARDLAGFDARVPAYLPGPEAARFEVKGHTQVAFHVAREGLQLVLQTAGMDPEQIPASVENGVIQCTAPSSVYIEKGPFSIIQVNDPSVEYPDGLNPQLIGEAGLRILGVPAGEARSISERIDWTTTVLLPVPTNIAEVRDVTVAGAQGVLLMPRQIEGAAQGEAHPDGAVLLMEKDNIVYMVSGSNSYEELLRIAESMF
jgi:hypothetical protein